jgi:mRNA-degrading endonuclease RelE of RelBE toxin-antitoxin system
LPYKSIFAKSFTKEFDKLPRNVKERILEALEKAAETPYAGTRLRGKLEGLWRW